MHTKRAFTLCLLLLTLFEGGSGDSLYTTDPYILIWTPDEALLPTDYELELSLALTDAAGKERVEQRGGQHATAGQRQLAQQLRHRRAQPPARLQVDPPRQLQRRPRSQHTGRLDIESAVGEAQLDGRLRPQGLVADLHLEARDAQLAAGQIHLEGAELRNSTLCVATGIGSGKKYHSSAVWITLTRSRRSLGSNCNRVSALIVLDETTRLLQY